MTKLHFVLICLAAYCSQNQITVVHIIGRKGEPSCANGSLLQYGSQGVALCYSSAHNENIQFVFYIFMPKLNDQFHRHTDNHGRLV